MKKFELVYNVSNGGDGSASPEFFATTEDAQKAEDEASEGWGEPSVGSLVLVLKDDELFFEKYDWDKPGKNKTVLVPIKKVKK